MTTIIEVFPEEVFIKIFQFLLPSEKITVSEVCETWKCIVFLPHLWRNSLLCSGQNDVNRPPVALIVDDCARAINQRVMRKFHLAFRYCSEEDIQKVIDTCARNRVTLYSLSFLSSGVNTSDVEMLRRECHVRLLRLKTNAILQRMVDCYFNDLFEITCGTEHDWLSFRALTISASVLTVLELTNLQSMTTNYIGTIASLPHLYRLHVIGWLVSTTSLFASIENSQSLRNVYILQCEVPNPDEDLIDYMPFTRLTQLTTFQTDLKYAAAEDKLEHFENINGRLTSVGLINLDITDADLMYIVNMCDRITDMTFNSSEVTDCGIYDFIHRAQDLISITINTMDSTDVSGTFWIKEILVHSHLKKIDIVACKGLATDNIKILEEGVEGTNIVLLLPETTAPVVEQQLPEQPQMPEQQQ